jgi:hypothetical protein
MKSLGLPETYLMLFNTAICYDAVGRLSEEGTEANVMDANDHDVDRLLLQDSGARAVANVTVVTVNVKAPAPTEDEDYWS